MDLWLLQAARVMTGRRPRKSDRTRADTTLDELVKAEPNATMAEAGLDPSMRFSLRLARGLMSYGMPAYRVEDALERVADALEFEIDVFCTPTALIVTLERENETRTQVLRVQPGGTDLEKLSALYELVGRVERKEIGPADAAHRLDTILARPGRYGPIATALAYALVSAVSATLLGGGGYDIPFAGLLGLIVGVLEAAAMRVPSLARLLPSIAAFTVSFGATFIAVQGMAVRPSVLLLAATLVLLPGLTLTTAMVELATAHLVAGTSRLMAAIVTFLQLGFGVALGRHFADLLPHVPRVHDAPELPWWTELGAPFAAALAFSVLLKARPDDRGWILFAAGISLAGSRLGGFLLGAELGAFVASMLVASAAHAFARMKDRPIALILTPGILSLVPGSVGFLSVRSLLEGDVANAIETAFRMLLVAFAIAAGMLVATAAVPPRRPI
ncbi:MAG: threonine/serine exporter family protein [Deltaproteobacteria bacterium]|nr:threonine/serine exporter family protein [Deltaproteobacteria bacterium]